MTASKLLPPRRSDYVTEVRTGSSVLFVPGGFRRDTTDTTADKMAKVLEAKATGQPGQITGGHTR